jgi:hypothetical protein
MYAIVGMFEIVLRNSIDRHFASVKEDTWLEDAVQPGGYPDVSPGCEDLFHSANESIHKLGTDYTHDALIAKLTFGFWTYQFAKKEYAASGSTGSISTISVSDKYSLILELLYWLGCQTKRILYGIDGVPQAINLVNSI